MGCLKLTYQKVESSPLKVVHRSSDVKQKSEQRFLSVDPHASRYPNLSPYAYGANNPLVFVDPDGRDHIHYLVFQKGFKGANSIAKHAQSILDNNGVNLQVQIMYVGSDGLQEGYQGLLDKTDALTFIGNENFVESLSGSDIGQGISDGRVGYVDVGAVSQALEGRENLAGDLDQFVARTAIHEGVGHPFAGSGHTDLNKSESMTALRYGGNYMFDGDGNFIPNIMTSGHNTVYSDKRTFNFVSPDLNLIKSKIPDYSTLLNINGCTIELCRDNAYPKDNFTNRLDGQ